MALIRNASILFVCTMIGNVSNYCFQFVMGRNLSVEDYGTMNALLSLLSGITLPASAVMLVIARYSAVYSAEGEVSGLCALYRGSLRNVLITALLASGVFIASSPWIEGYMKIGSVSTVLMLAIGIFGAFALTVNLGMLQGMQKFLMLGSGIGLGGVLRLFLGIAFLLFGLRLNGAVLASALPAVLVFALTIAPLSGFLKRTAGSFRFEGMFSYSVPVIVSSVAFAFLSNVDLIMVKHYMSPYDAGLYASAAVLGKTLLYLPSSFALAVFPMVSEAEMRNGDPDGIFDKALASTALICAAGVILFAVMPEALLSFLFGQRFLPAAGLLKYYGAAMSAMAILSVTISYNLARRRTGFIYPLIAGCALMPVSIAVFHTGLFEVMFLVTLVLTATASLSVLQVYRNRHGMKRVSGLTRCASVEADMDSLK